MLRRQFLKTTSLTALDSAALLVLHACGGGGSEQTASNPPAPVIPPAPPPTSTPDSSPPPSPIPSPTPSPPFYGVMTSYDLNDPDLVLARTLTSMPQPLPGANEKGEYTSNLIQPSNAAPAIDSTLGLKLPINTSLVMCNLVSDGKLQTIGQCYFEVEHTYFAAKSDQSLGSNGQSLTNSENPLQLSQTIPAVSGKFMAIMIDTAKLIGLSNSQGSAGSHFNNIEVPAIQTHIPVVLYWQDNRFGIYINGRFGGVVNTTLANIQDIVKNLVFGNYSGRIRNLLLVNRAPAFKTLSEDYQTFCIFGDSYSTAGQNPEGSGSYDGAITSQLEGQLGLAKVKLNWPYAGVNTNSGANLQTFPGHHIYGYQTEAAPLDIAVDNDPITNSTTLLWDKLHLIFQLNPTCILIQAGVNDWFDGTTYGNFDGVKFQRWLKRYVQRILGLDTFGYGKYPATSVKRLFIATTPFAPLVDTSGLRAKDAVTDKDCKYAVLDWFNATYPAMIGKLVIVPVFEAFGGLDASDTLFNSSNGDFLHPNNRGTALMGKTYAEAILKNLG